MFDFLHDFNIKANSESASSLKKILVPLDEPEKVKSALNMRFFKNFSITLSW